MGIAEGILVAFNPPEDSLFGYLTGFSVPNGVPNRYVAVFVDGELVFQGSGLFSFIPTHDTHVRIEFHAPTPHDGIGMTMSCYSDSGPLARSLRVDSSSCGASASFWASLESSPYYSWSPVSAQWFKDGLSLSDGPTETGSVRTGCTTDRLQITQTSEADSGEYTLVLSSSQGSVRAHANLFVCRGDFNCNGGVEGSDVFDFFDAWEAGMDSSDINLDGGIDGADVSAFFEVWERGC